MDTMNFTVVLGSVRPNRVGIRAARFICAQIEKRGNKATLVDPLEYPLPLLDMRYSDYEPGKAPEMLQKLSKIFAESDAVIAVTAEYNHTMPPALSNLMDYFRAEYQFKPGAAISYSGGPFGGVRASMHLENFFSELGMPVVANLPIPAIQNVLDESGKAIDPKMDERAGAFLEKVEWWASALSDARKKGVPKSK